MSGELKLLQEALERPETFYHVTREENLPNIKKKGLIPKIGELSKMLGEKKKVVYLFDSQKSTEDALLNWMGEEYENIEEETGEEISLAILEITLPKDFNVTPTFKQDNESFEWTTSETINPKYIKVWKTGQ